MHHLMELRIGRIRTTDAAAGECFNVLHPSVPPVRGTA
ncbi:hypothetical protein PSMK_00780 [Phycisphaera mikurensis NBRC 102666]|uniref:Uncharacterized protein n=1 Tax=Phycisphaera mikurensis (strain NBRC 102666 / KCTC 22515 / FYK2301M01) TaxID=1142394 RepID=I0IAE9_PHYMF|nr:hypothetical protein PSMK_00780 [Phycisphaera mikurensis NBRC 102666]